MAEIDVAPVRGARRPFSPVALASFLLALLVGLVAALSGLGSRWGWWHFRAGFTLLRWSAYAAIAVALLSLAGAYLSRPGSGRRGLPLALLALLICLVVVAVPTSRRRMAAGAPGIHDITTDVANPPPFVAVVPLRRDAANPVEYGGPEIAAQQRKAYPDLRPVILDLAPQRAFQKALDAAKDMGWEIVGTDPRAGRIEATDQTFWFGFKDDVVIRLTPQGQRTVVDVRSVSRVGRGDMGTNARRVRDYLAKLQES